MLDLLGDQLEGTLHTREDIDQVDLLGRSGELVVRMTR